MPNTDENKNFDSKLPNTLFTDFANINNEYITFKFGTELYAIEILKIKEITNIIEITNVPKMPPHIKGVMNLRGDIIPVIDLAKKFGFKDIKYNEFSVIVVVLIENRLIGILAEEILDVQDIKNNNVSDRVSVGSNVQSEFIQGIANINDKPVMILDIKKLLELENIK